MVFLLGSHYTMIGLLAVSCGLIGYDAWSGGKKPMCLAVPALVKSIDGDQAEVELGGVSRRASLMLTPEAKVGDYVLLHAGYAINVLDQAEAEETLSILREMARLTEDVSE